MRSNLGSYRPVLLFSAALILSVSLVVALGVLGAVTAEFYRGATPEKDALGATDNTVTSFPGPRRCHALQRLSRSLTQG